MCPARSERRLREVAGEVRLEKNVNTKRLVRWCVWLRMHNLSEQFYNLSDGSAGCLIPKRINMQNLVGDKPTSCKARKSLAKTRGERSRDHQRYSTGERTRLTHPPTDLGEGGGRVPNPVFLVPVVQELPPFPIILRGAGM